VKEQQLYLKKVNIHSFVNGVTIHKVTSGVPCHLYKWLRWTPPIRNKMGTRTLFSCRGSHPRLQAIKLLASLIQSTQNFVSLYPTSTRPSPHRRPIWHRSPRGWQARVAPAPKAPSAAAQGWRSSSPSPQARHPVPPGGAQGGQSCGYRSPPTRE
jgi:hypothetical protein